MIGPGLSLEQAPPVSLPMRFFLTAPLFGVAAGLLVALRPSLIASRWTPGMLAATHLFLLGVIVMTMLGALQQLLPVAAGAPLRAPRLTGTVSHAAWTMGTGALAGGLLTGTRAAIGTGAVLLIVGAAAFLAGASRILTTKARGETAGSIRLALLGFAVTLTLGAILAAGHAGLTGLRRFPLTDLHATWGILGWIAALIIGVTWQLVPMLFTTPPHPAALRRFAVPLLVVLLIARSLPLPSPVPSLLQFALAGLFGAFAGSSLRCLSRRRRSVPDASVSLLRFAMLALMAAVVLALATEGIGAAVGHEIDGATGLAAALLLVVGFASSVVVALLLKIVPFLTWFHLQAAAGRAMAAGRPAPAVQTMKDLLGDARARVVTRLHAAACVAMVGAPFVPGWASSIAGLLLAASFAALGLAMIPALLALRRGLREAALGKRSAAPA